MTDIQINNLRDILISNMAEVEQFVNWENALNPNNDDADYYKALKGIVEPIIEDNETSLEFSNMLENNFEQWKSIIISLADGLVYKDKWGELTNVFEKYGY